MEMTWKKNHSCSNFLSLSVLKCGESEDETAKILIEKKKKVET